MHIRTEDLAMDVSYKDLLITTHKLIDAWRKMIARVLVKEAASAWSMTTASFAGQELEIEIVFVTDVGRLRHAQTCEMTVILSEMARLLESSVRNRNSGRIQAHMSPLKRAFPACAVGIIITPRQIPVAQPVRKLAAELELTANDQRLLAAHERAVTSRQQRNEQAE